MAQSLGQVTFSDPAGSDQKDVGRLYHEAGRGQFREERLVGLRQKGEVESIEGLLRPEAGAADPHDVFLLFSSSNFILDQESQELGIGEFSSDRLLSAKRH